MKKILLSIGILLLFAGLTTGAVKTAGSVSSIDSVKKEILVNVKSGTDLKMGDLLEMDTDSGRIILEVTYPMLTVTKCRMKGKGELSAVRKGMPVYFYGKSPEKDSSKEEEVTKQRLSDNGQGIITDNNSGLMWLKDANPTRKSMSWEEAMEFIESLQAAGYNDWRLPTKEEFEYFLKIGSDEIKKSFDNVRIFYWTSTSYALSDGYIWVADVGDGVVNYSFKSNDNYIWPVRDGKTRVRRSANFNKDDKVNRFAIQKCQKNNEEFVSYSVELDGITSATYGVKCKKNNKETRYNIKYDKLLGSWSD